MDTNVVVLNSSKRRYKELKIGKGQSVKVNANIGASPNASDAEKEIVKAELALNSGADTIMDLSICKNMNSIRKELLRKVKAPLGTVPIYQTAFEKGLEDMTGEDMLNTIEQHGKEGVDFVTVHCGITLENSSYAKKRLIPVVSRGGCFLANWMNVHKKENPLYENFDSLLDIAKDNDLCLSLGDALRSGCIKDGNDRAMLDELRTLGKLVERCASAGVQCMVEGPGHLRIDQIRENIELQKKVCHGAPYYVLGPLVTDVAAGYDHISSAIGGALAAYYGADFLCYVCPSEHLGLPIAREVREGVIASKIAAHAADLTRGIDTEWDDRLSGYRRDLNWEKMFENLIDPEKAREIYKRTENRETCSMCGEYCSVKLSKKLKDPKLR